MGQQPIFGLIANHNAPIDSGMPFGPLTSYYRQLIEYSTTQGWQSYLFSPRDVLRQRQTIWAWVRHDGTWQRAFVPPPTVAYTRMPRFTDEERDILLWLRDEGGAQFINQPELDEITQDYWRLIQVLQSHPTLTPYVLDSTLLRDTGSLRSLLDEFPAVLARSRYARPGTSGSASLARRGEEFLLRQEVKGAGHTRPFRSPVKLRAVLEELFGEVVLQQYLEPFRIESCPVTLRSLWQRTRSGGWAESATMLRVGQAESRTYQAVTAGLVDRYERSLSEFFGTQLKSMQYQVSNIGKTVVELLNQRTHGAGELSVELLVTADRSLKLLDVSTVAGVDALRRLPDPRTSQEVMRLTMQYAATLHAQARTTVPNQAPLETA